MYKAGHIAWVCYSGDIFSSVLKSFIRKKEMDQECIFYYTTKNKILANRSIFSIAVFYSVLILSSSGKSQRIILLSNVVRDLLIVQIDTLRCTDLNMKRMDAGFKSAS